MKTPIDFDRLQRILEKCERGEALGPEEREYGEIVRALKSKSQTPVSIDVDFRRELKNELMETYDETYPAKKSFFPKLHIAFVRFAVSFCLLLTVGFGMYGWLGSPIKNSETRMATYAPDIASEESRPAPSPGSSAGAPALDREWEKPASSQDISDSANVPKKNIGPALGFVGDDRDASEGGSVSDSLKWAPRQSVDFWTSLPWAGICASMLLASAVLIFFLRKRAYFKK